MSGGYYGKNPQPDPGTGRGGRYPAGGYYNENRDALYQGTQSSSRKPRPPVSGGYGAPPAPSRADMGGAAIATPTRPVKLRVQKQDSLSPYKDLVYVSPANFPPNPNETALYIMLASGPLDAPPTHQHVITAKRADVVNPSTACIHPAHRIWMNIANTDILRASPYDPFQGGRSPFITSMEMEISFQRAPSAADSVNPYTPQLLDSSIKNICIDHIFAPTQKVVIGVGAENRLLVFEVAAIKLMDLLAPDSEATIDTSQRGIMTSETIINFVKKPNDSIRIDGPTASHQAPEAIISPDFKFESLGIGGLDAEFSVIFRRAFASRLLSPDLVNKLGLPHVKGILLYGPPGTGKTLIARQIGQMLKAREPKIVNGPEILNKYQGQSEENVRNLFVDAEKEYKECGDRSKLHTIIFDELEAVCRKRGTTTGGTGTGDTIVNQLLSKLDGVNQLNNILLIGMTNRKDMMDDALLRPGRLEVQIEIGLPDEYGRSQILTIHTEKLRKNGTLSDSVDIPELAGLTKNFSGAELAGLVRSASSFAMNRHIQLDALSEVKLEVDDLEVGHPDFLKALDEVKPAFGAPEDEISDAIPMGIIHYNSTIESIITRAGKYWNTTAPSMNQPGSVSNILLYGSPKSGTTAIAAHLAALSTYPFVKIVTLGTLSSMRDEYAKADYIARVFADAYKSPLSVVILDEIDLIFEYVPLGPRFSNHLLSALKGKMKENPPKGHRLLILSTTCNFGIMDMVDLRRSFSATMEVPVVKSLEELQTILMEAKPFPSGEDVRDALSTLQRMGVREIDLGIKLLLEQAFIARGSELQSVGQDFADGVGNAINDRLLSH